jgi:hypothetical protein
MFAFGALYPHGDCILMIAFGALYPHGDCILMIAFGAYTGGYFE